MAAVAAVGILSGCSNNRGGVADAMLDRTLYTADSKAERLFRYYEIQALLVRYAALFGGSASDRDAIAAANVVATGRFREVFDCLHYGAVNAARVHDMSKEAADALIREKGYCSFFDMRMLSYENALVSLLRHAVGYDEAVSELKVMVKGLSAADVWTILTDLITVAGRVARDVRVIEAFKADARELQFIIYQDYTGPEAISHRKRIARVFPESDPPEVIERKLESWRNRPRPEVRVWHFQEVTAFLRDSCYALNKNAPLDNFKGTTCATGLPFVETLTEEQKAATVSAAAAGTAAAKAASPSVIPAATAN